MGAQFCSKYYSNQEDKYDNNQTSTSHQTASLYMILVYFIIAKKIRYNTYQMITITELLTVLNVTEIYKESHIHHRSDHMSMAERMDPDKTRYPFSH